MPVKRLLAEIRPFGQLQRRCPLLAEIPGDFSPVSCESFFREGWAEGETRDDGQRERRETMGAEMKLARRERRAEGETRDEREKKCEACRDGEDERKNRPGEDERKNRPMDSSGRDERRRRCLKTESRPAFEKHLPGAFQKTPFGTNKTVGPTHFKCRFVVTKQANVPKPWFQTANGKRAPAPNGC